MAVMRISDEGWKEKRCNECGEWWPDDKEFFFQAGSDPDKTMNKCKACYIARRRSAGTKPMPRYAASQI